MSALHTFIVASFVTVLIAVPAYAEVKNPQKRICNQLSGLYFEAGNELDLYGFCSFDRSSVGTLDLLRFYQHEESVSALQTYLNNVRNCEPFGQVTTLTTADGDTEIFCKFADGSMLDNKTLSTGINDKRNEKLNTALGIIN